MEHVLNGYNSTLFAYGMTGTGKTYTIFGNQKSNQFLKIIKNKKNDNQGISYLIIQELFEQIALKESEGKRKFEVTLAYIEIYNEQIRDMLSTNPKKHPNIIEDQTKGLIITDLKEISVSNII